MRNSSRRRVTLALTALILSFFAVAVLVHTKIEEQRADSRAEEVLYVPSAKTLKRMSFGYTGLLADIYWTRAVQYFGWKHKHREMDYGLLYPLLDITTQLDPNLIVAYRFGGTFLAQEPPNGAGQPGRAAELIQRGIKANPNDWQLFYDLGFLEAMELQNYTAAAEAFNQGSRIPGAHPFLKILAAAMAQHGGDHATARMLWQTSYETSEEPLIKQNAVRHLRALQVDETVPRLEEAVQEFRKKAGVQPRNFSEVVSAGLLPKVPLDPIGTPYKLLPSGKVVVQDPDSLPFIKEGLPPDYKPAMESVPRMPM